MKNIWNDPRSLFNGNYFSSYYVLLASERSERDTLRSVQSRIVYIYTRNVLLSAQMGERASVVLICIITSQRAHSLKLFCMYDKRFEISKTK